MFESKHMSVRSVRHFLIFLAIGAGFGGCEDLFDFDVNEVVPSIYRVVVIELARDENGQIIRDEKNKEQFDAYSGTGFLVSGDKFVVTSHHVVKDAAVDTKGPIIFVGYLKSTSTGVGDNVEREPMWVRAKIEAKDEAKDIAILKAERALPGRPLRLADFGESKPRDGEIVKSIGFPLAADFDLNRNVSAAGIIDQFSSVSSLLVPTKTDGSVSRTFEYQDALHIQHQAPISGGNSGGPLFDECGVVVGVNSFKSSEEGYIGAAIYSKAVVSLLKKEGLEPVTHGQQCNAQNYKRLMPFAVGGAGILLSTMAMVIALRRPAIRERVTRMIPTVGRTNMRGTDARRPPSEMGAYPTMVAPERGSRATFGGSLQLVPTGSASPIAIGLDQLSGAGAVLGRQRDCDIVVENETVSKRHARLSMTSGGKLSVEDLNSGNGTWRGKERITNAIVEDGETIRFGNMSYRVALSRPGVSDGKIAGSGTVLMNATARRSEHCWMLSGFDDGGKVVQFTLEARIDPATGKEAETNWTIGRKPDRVDHVLLDRSVSSEHARIRFSPGRGLEISDLGSSNGTKVDGTAVSSGFVALEGVRSIEFGRFKMTLSRA